MMLGCSPHFQSDARRMNSQRMNAIALTSLDDHRAVSAPALNRAVVPAGYQNLRGGDIRSGEKVCVGHHGHDQLMSN